MPVLEMAMRGLVWLGLGGLTVSYERLTVTYCSVKPRRAVPAMQGRLQPLTRMRPITPM